jgi:hypothetical protein
VAHEYMTQAVLKVPNDRVPMFVADVLMPAGGVAWPVTDRPNRHTFTPSAEFPLYPTNLCIEMLSGNPADPAEAPPQHDVVRRLDELADLRPGLMP